MSQPTIASVGLVTSDRLAGLERALASYLENAGTHGRTPEFVVVDDSREAGTREACRQMLRTQEATHGKTLRYAGLEEKLGWADKLIARGDVPPEVVRFALFAMDQGGYTSGANRNALLLQTAGEMVLSVDDDTLCRVALPPERGAGLGFSANRDPAEYWFFPDREAALASVEFVEQDVLAAHEQLLGRAVRPLLAASGAVPGIHGADLDLCRRLDAQDATVAVTFNGLVGDCGWGAPFGYWGRPMGYLLLPDASHARLMRSAGAYRAACQSREVLRIASRVTLADASFSMTTFAGLDNRRLLPPFLPVGRGQDLIFGTMLWTCFEDAALGHVPWALLHAPLEIRRFWPGEVVRSASGGDVAKLLLACIDAFDAAAGGAPGAARLRALGSHLVALGSMPPREFEAVASRQVARAADALAVQLENRLQETEGSPDFWANDVRRYLEILRRSASRRDFWVPLDLLDGRGVEEARRLAQHLVVRFGELLTWWPTIVDGARELRAQDLCLAPAV